MIDDAYAAATTPVGKMTYIWPRAEVYAWLKRPLELVADYEALAKQLPKEAGRRKAARTAGPKNRTRPTRAKRAKKATRKRR